MLKIKNVVVSLNNNKILNNVDYLFHNNKVYGLLGPNGAGKTTLFKSILGVIDFHGEISMSSKHIGHLIEYPAFYSNLSCEENLKLHARYIGIKDIDVDYLLKTVNLQEAKKKKFKNLSMGMKQRLGIAKTLIGNSDLVLLDEPSNGLDPFGIKDIRDIILNEVKENNRITIVSSHILQEISEFTDIFVFIKEGRIISHLKNTMNYSMLEINSISDIPFKTSNEYSIIKSNDRYYIIGNYDDIKNYDTNIKMMSLEDIYLTIMQLEIEEVHLK
ncbi:ATP-binding cassette domain-containing protein [Macrococcus capreoli]